jgi:hypothetical protein
MAGTRRALGDGRAPRRRLPRRTAALWRPQNCPAPPPRVYLHCFIFRISQEFHTVLPEHRATAAVQTLFEADATAATLGLALRRHLANNEWAAIASLLQPVCAGGCCEVLCSVVSVCVCFRLRLPQGL